MGNVLQDGINGTSARYFRCITTSVQSNLHVLGMYHPNMYASMPRLAPHDTANTFYPGAPGNWGSHATLVSGTGHTRPVPPNFPPRPPPPSLSQMPPYNTPNYYPYNQQPTASVPYNNFNDSQPLLPLPTRGLYSTGPHPATLTHIRSADEPLLPYYHTQSLAHAYTHHPQSQWEDWPHIGAWGPYLQNHLAPQAGPQYAPFPLQHSLPRGYVSEAYGPSSGLLSAHSASSVPVQAETNRAHLQSQVIPPFTQTQQNNTVPYPHPQPSAHPTTIPHAPLLPLEPPSSRSQNNSFPSAVTVSSDGLSSISQEIGGEDTALERRRGMYIFYRVKILLLVQ